VLFFSTFFSFIFVSLGTNPLVAIRTNPRVTPQAIALMVHQTHLDKPVIVRYFYWLEAIFTQKLGRSLITLKPIWPDITRTMGHTAQLIILSESLAIILGIAVGIYSAIRQYSFFDYSFTTISFLGFAMPVFWLALVLQLLFVDVYNKWHVRIVYTSGLNTIPGGPSWSLDRMQHLALPVITLLVVSFALYSRYMRASMLDVINSDYVRTARAKGVAERKVVMRHVFRNALIPITTVAALNVGGLLGGAIVTETIFTLDGMGHYFILALGQGDTYEIMAYLLVTAVIIIVFNLIADITYGFLDPRIRYD
jgi:peptide/nickel transport system permease protein